MLGRLRSFFPGLNGPRFNEPYIVSFSTGQEVIARVNYTGRFNSLRNVGTGNAVKNGIIWLDVDTKTMGYNICVTITGPDGCKDYRCIDFVTRDVCLYTFTTGVRSFSSIEAPFEIDLSDVADIEFQLRSQYGNDFNNIGSCRNYEPCSGAYRSASFTYIPNDEDEPCKKGGKISCNACEEASGHLSGIVVPPNHTGELITSSSGDLCGCIFPPGLIADEQFLDGMAASRKDPYSFSTVAVFPCDTEASGDDGGIIKGPPECESIFEHCENCEVDIVESSCEYLFTCKDYIPPRKEYVEGDRINCFSFMNDCNVYAQCSINPCLGIDPDEVLLYCSTGCYESELEPYFGKIECGDDEDQDNICDCEQIKNKVINCFVCPELATMTQLTSDVYEKVERSFTNERKDDNLKDETDQNFYIYPNPFKNSVFLKGPFEHYQNSKISIFNVLGSVVYSATIQNSMTGTIEINLDDLRLLSGMYFVVIEDDNSVIHSEKLVKE